MADEKAMENEIAREIERDLEPMKPVGQISERIVRSLRPIGADPNDDRSRRWLAMGEQLHDQQAAAVKTMLADYETRHAELVIKQRELSKLAEQIQTEADTLRAMRRRLGYSQ